jgi:hypothetical protein
MHIEVPSEADTKTGCEAELENAGQRKNKYEKDPPNTRFHQPETEKGQQTDNAGMLYMYVMLKQGSRRPDRH